MSRAENNVSPITPIIGDQFEAPENLRLDLQNPRIPDESFASEEEVLEYLLDHADIQELIQSILSSGWLDYEPLIVLDNENIVLEGNRRLAALRILADDATRKRFDIELPEEPGPESQPKLVRVRRVNSRSDARDFIGFKHINGPFKWDALAKAKYAAEWLSDGATIDHVSRRLGDNHNTIRRLVNGWYVLQQALAEGFNREETTKRSFPFSHLYTAVARPNVRSYLGLQDDNLSEVLPVPPVPTERGDNLRQLMSWLYGQRNEPAVVVSQNPDLNRLVEVLGNDNARTMLEATRDLHSAYDQVEDKSLQFSRSLMLTIKQAEDTLRLVGNFDGRADLMTAGDNLKRTVQSLHGAMKTTKERLEQGEDNDAN